MNKRRNYFIKKRFQAGFFIRFALLLIIEAIVIAGLFMFVSRETLTTAYNEAGLTIQKTSIYFLLDFVFISCIAGAGIGIAGILVFLFLSHRIGGPLYKVEKVLEEARYGNIAKRVDLRKTDQLMDLRDQVNELLEETDRRVSMIKLDVNKALQLVSEGGEANIVRLKEVLQRLKSALDHFKTSK